MPYERETFAKIFVNGEYVGLYLIVEPIDKRFLLSWFGEDTGYLYEGHGGEIQYRFKYRGDDPNAYLPETVPNVIGDHDGAIRTDHRARLDKNPISERHVMLHRDVRMNLTVHPEARAFTDEASGHDD